MKTPQSRPAMGAVVYLVLMCLAAMYFTFASVQGDYGLFRRIQIDAERQALEAERAALLAEVAALENKTRRLSDDFLDLELLDQQARDVLGLVRPDEMVLR
ncbi:MAG: septum formation initiator family protein [Pseudomonadota bacterium]